MAKPIILSEDICAGCHHGKSLHAEDLFGISCKGKILDDQEFGKDCDCTAFEEPPELPRCRVCQRQVRKAYMSVQEHGVCVDCATGPTARERHRLQKEGR